MAPNAYAAHLLDAAASHERDGHVEIARAMRSVSWAVTSRRTLEAVLRLAVDEWDEDALRAHLDAADDAARRST